MKFDLQRVRESLRDTYQRASQSSRNTYQLVSQRVAQSSRNAYQQVSQRVTQSSGLRGSFSFQEQLRELVSSIQFLSVVPVPGSKRLFATQDDSSRIIKGSGYFSLVGFLIGLITCIIPFLFRSLLPSFVLSILAIIVLVVLTGGVHLDGLMDTCDGVFGRQDRADKLTIMRDSRVGAFGVLGAACVLLAKFALLGSMGSSLLFPALLVAPAVSRWCVVLAMRLFPSARPDGMGDEFRQSITVPYLVVSGVIALLVALIFGHVVVGLLVWVGASVVAIIIGMWMTRVLGGLTGDVGGAIVEVTEVVALLLFLLFRFWY
ncbi:MAG TPA: adenosylcobinamide-GDP ribazoletransferase [Ktedonobacteraceae bacterium]|jgi:adenosylcobinamide-GDP ribazoletransferase